MSERKLDLADLANRVSDGTPVEIVELQGTRGHLDGVLSIAQAGDRIRAFLEK